MAKYKPGQWIEYSPVDDPYPHTGVIMTLLVDDDGKPTGQYQVRENDMEDSLQTVNERFIYRVIRNR